VSELESEESAGIIAGKLLESMSAPYLNLGGHDVDSSVSIGIALYPGDGQEIDTLLSHADTAMYCAKMSGRGKYCFYEASLNKSSARESELIAGFPRALRDNEFCLHYQIRVGTADLRPVGLEALIRWQHPINGLIYPIEFIGLAEDNDFIIALGNWVIDAACAQVAAWRDLGCTVLPVAVNISAKQLSNDSLVDFMIHSLRRHDVPAELIEIEVTESCLLEQPDIAAQVLEKLHELGIKISLDDYGTGFSGLSHLKRLPITTVKIDRSFIRDIRNDASDAMIVSSTIALSHNLGLKVVAEGVETKEQVVHLKAAGCDELQGYYFHKPAPASEITSALTGTLVQPGQPS
jgi:EAL domain-containing protein (putative c-di-GMP-specific phosphodiesterase class I)